MPFVLSAIDLKLASNTEIDSRRRRLERLGEILSNSGRVYDVMDFIIAQTNHILRLAYITSRDVFLLRGDEGARTLSDASLFMQSPDRNVGLNDANSHLQKPPKSRARNWHDAFLRHPRAYLLLSTTVDHFMSVGQLPQDYVLPYLVRSIPRLGIRVRLSWPPERQGLCWEQDREQGDQPGPLNDLSPSSTMWDSILPQKPDKGTHKNIEEYAGYGPSEESPINLDYLPLDQSVGSSPQAGPALGAMLSQTSPSNLGLDKGEFGEVDLLQLNELAATYDTFYHFGA